MSTPVIELSGRPYDQGLQHGRGLRSLVEHNVRFYTERFEKIFKISREDLLAYAKSYLPIIEKESPTYLENMRGIAEGAQVDLLGLTVLNLRYELAYYTSSNDTAEKADGCTAFVVLPEISENGHLMIGDNWDWLKGVRVAVLKVTQPDGFQQIIHTQAGIPGGVLGLNSAQVGLVINGMRSTRDEWRAFRKPLHVRCYEILQTRDLDSAIRVVTSGQRSGSTNFIIAQAPDRVVNIEAAPDGVHSIDPKDGCLTHANHFVDAAAAGAEEVDFPLRPISCERAERMAKFIKSKSKVSIEDLQRFQSNHVGLPYSICRHPGEGEVGNNDFGTVTSVIADLTEGALYFTDSNPCQSEYRKVDFK